MERRIVSFLTVGILVCIFVGCGNQQETNSTVESNTVDTNTIQLEEPTNSPYERVYVESIITEATCEADGLKLLPVNAATAILKH